MRSVNIVADLLNLFIASAYIAKVGICCVPLHFLRGLKTMGKQLFLF